VPVGAGYEQVVASLGRRPGGERLVTERDRAPRQFIFGDGAGGVERIRVDFSGPHLHHLCEVLDTTPDAQRRDVASGDLVPAGPSTQPGREAAAARAMALGHGDSEFAPEIDGAMAAADAELGLEEENLAHPADAHAPSDSAR
jgi:hypothetical protein